MEHELDPEVIKEKAKEIYDLSLNFHLCNAMIACDRYMKSKFRNKLNKELEQINIEYMKALKREDVDKIKRLKEDMDKLKKDLKEKKYVISLDYVPSMGEESGRVIRQGNCLCITLPQSLRDKQQSDVNVVRKLEKTMAHEIGHIILHTDDVFKQGTQGSFTNMSSKKSNGSDGQYLDKNRDKFEHAAKIFETAILNLYHKTT